MIKYKNKEIYIHKISIFLLLLIIFFFTSSKKYKKEKKNKKILIKESEIDSSPIIHNYKLFNDSDYPFVSIVFDLSHPNNYSTNDSLINFLLELSENIFIDIQIIFLRDISEDIIQNETIKQILKEKRIEILSLDCNNWVKSFFDLFYKIKGKFFILFEQKIIIKKEHFQIIFNTTKGSSENIFKLELFQNNSIYLIRTKALKNIIDEEIYFKNFKEIIKYIFQQPKHKLNNVQVVLCPDNYYTPLTYTSMISILITKDYYTYISFFLIIPKEFSQKNINFIETLYEQFDYFNISFLKMDNRYEKAYTNRYLTKNAFYRLSLGELLPNSDKVIYLDSDTIILKDLSNLYNLNFFGKIFVAKINTFTSLNNFTINTGVLLLNLKGMRKIKIEEKVLTLLNNGFKDPCFHDQAIINKFFKEYIGFLPPEYNTFTFNLENVKQYKKDSSKLYDFDNLYFSFKFPSIIHYRGEPKDKIANAEDWYYFARKSKYFNKRSSNFIEIFNFTK